MKSIRYYLEYILVNFLLLLVRPLPHSGVIFLGRSLGFMVFHLSKSRRRSALKNLNIMFSDSKSVEEKKRIIKKSFKILAVSTLQSIWVTTKTKERVRQLIKSKPIGLDTLRKCLGKQKGIFFLTAHYGNWEIMGLHHGLLDICPLSSIVRKLDNPYLDKIVTEMRTATGNKIFYRNDSLIKIVRELKNNNSVAVMMDQNTAKGGLFVDFFGLKAATPRALAQLSYRMGTPVIPLFSYPTEAGTYNIEYGPELILEKSGNKKKDILDWTQKMETFIESVIRKTPSPWMCGHRRWKTRPPDEKNIRFY